MSKHYCIAMLGIGHTNAEVVLRWAKSPIPDCRLVCISKFPYATYSGMLPGTLANQFSQDAMQIPLAPLVARAGGELILDEVVGLEREARTLHFANRSPLSFDALSIGVGSMPAGWDQFDSPNLVPIKPMQTFIPRLDQRVVECEDNSSAQLKVVIVGGGVAGVEIAFCVHARLTNQLPTRRLKVQIVTSSEAIGDGLRKRSVVKLQRLLSLRSIDVVTNFRVTKVEQVAVVGRDGQRQEADIVLWATGASPPSILGKLNLPTDERGFLATDPTLRSTGSDPIFAVGDSGSVIANPTPKAGVYAVRQAPVLWKNLKATIQGEPLTEFHPQADFLKILNTGDGKALLQYKGLCFHAGWCWRLKAWIDGRFLQGYQI